MDTVIQVSLYRHETAHVSVRSSIASRVRTWHLPQAHFLESWGDARAYDGTYTVVQPLIEPLYGGKS